MRSVALVVGMLILCACSGGGGGSSPVSPLPSPSPSPSAPGSPSPAPRSSPVANAAIKHVVVIVQENRTPDNIFNGYPGLDTVSSGTDSRGATVPLTPVDLANRYDMGHSHTDFLNQYDGGRMDGNDRVAVACNVPSGCGAEPGFRYVPQAQVQPYWTMAQRYVVADRMFQSNEGPSFPAHQYLISGTSSIATGSPLYASENVTQAGIGFGGQAGCAAAGSTVPEIDVLTGVESGRTASCFERQTLMDLLDAKGISWKYYAHNQYSIWTAPNAVAHLRDGSAWNKVVFPETTVLADIASGNLPQVSWVVPSAANSDHANSTAGTGPAWVAAIVDALGTSAYWNDTAIFITWDDWGGWYDHVAPPKRYNAYELGFRVPLVIVSPYAKRGYVSHQIHEFGSILHFTEATFGLPSLGTTDARADDLSDCFDLRQTPTAFRTIAAPVDARYFSRTTSASTAPPDDD